MNRHPTSWRDGIKSLRWILIARSRSVIDPAWGALTRRDVEHRAKQDAELRRIPIARVRDAE